MPFFLGTSFEFVIDIDGLIDSTESTGGSTTEGEEVVEDLCR